ncbi:MAG: helix-turn-helix domain-containing protein [Bacteroidales bacterium]|nr:helix-turn-helix domain-containing protein [Bacteroidales bacterium]
MDEQMLFSLPLPRFEPIFKRWVKEAISEIPSTAEPATPPDELLTISKAAELLHVSVPTIYGYVHQRTIPHMKRRGKLYFSRSEIMEWLQSSRKSTVEEIEQKAVESLNRRAAK